MPEETIAIRADERFDEAALAAYLQDKVPGADNPLQVRQFGGGAANLTYLLDYGQHQYVLRRPPLGPVARTAHDMAREYKVLSVLYQQYPYAPRALHYCTEEGIIGSDFLIMERRRGLVVRRTIPDQFAAIGDAPRRMSKALIDALAAFHAVDYEALGLADLGKPAGFVERQIEGWYQRWQKARLHDLPEMERVYTWLKGNRPRAGGYSLVHNDFKLDNIMLAVDDPGRVVAVFDWDMCTLGDPLSDLGALLTYWSEPADPPYLQAVTMMPVGDIGFMSREELVQSYAQKSGRTVQHINFYHALGLFRLTVIVAQIYFRFKQGQTQDQRFAAFDFMIPLLARAAKEKTR